MKILFHDRINPARDGRFLRLDLKNTGKNTFILLFRFHSSPEIDPLNDPGAGRMMVGLLPGLRVRMYLDLGLMEDGRSFHPRIPGVGVTYNSGPVKKLADIRALSILDGNQEKSGRVAIRVIGLAARKPVAGLVPPVRRLVDGLGQWKNGSWPGKSVFLGPEVAPPSPLNPAANPRRGAGARTGYITLIKKGGRSWLYSPEFGPFFSSGIDVIRPGAGGPVRGVEKLFSRIPPLLRGGRADVSFYTENLKRRYGTEAWADKWAALAVDRLAGWGFNTIGNWSDDLTVKRRRLPYVLDASRWDLPPDQGVFAGFPDVYSPDFERHCNERARLAVRPDDSLLIGYFLHNEPQWGHGRVNLAERALSGGTAPFTRRSLNAWLAGPGRRVSPGRKLELMQDLLLERYFSVVCGAMRRHDPNHLLLGVRYAAIPPACLIRPMRHMDVVTLNNYEPVPNPGLMADLHRLTGKPLLIGEFHFGAVDRGMRFYGLQGVATQLDRARAFARYMEAAASVPYCVGAHWFQYMDEPVLGRFDGENYNVGFVDVCDRPYREMESEARRTNARLGKIHAGKTAPRRLNPRYVSTGIVW